MLYKEPILVLVTIYLSVVYGVLYGREYLFIARQQTFLTISQSLKRSR
jgi:hypothetical protein